MVEDGFGVPEKKHVYEDHIDKWRFLHPRSDSTSFTGKIDRVKDGYYILNPFQGIDYSNGYPKLVIIEEDFPIETSQIYALQPTTEKSVRKYVEKTNEKESLKRKVEEAELEAKLKSLKPKVSKNQLSLDLKD